MNELELESRIFPENYDTKLDIEKLLESIPPLEFIDDRPQITLEFLVTYFKIPKSSITKLATHWHIAPDTLRKIIRKKTGYDDPKEFVQDMKNPKNALIALALKAGKNIDEKISRGYKGSIAENNFVMGTCLDKITKLDSNNKSEDAASAFVRMCKNSNASVKITLEAKYGKEEKKTLEIKNRIIND